MDKQSKKDVGAIAHKDSASFRVWAPFAEAVAVTGSFNNWSKTPMTSEGDGYWYVEVEKAAPGQEYKYVIVNSGREMYKNDPRSLQLTTSAGNSVIVSTDFDWSEDNYKLPALNEQVIYELHIGTFNRLDPSTPGTFERAVEKLDYLAELGINVIEIMPVSSMPMDRGWGYAADYIYAVESLYGGRRQFQQFVKEAHKKNIGVVLDVVYNHFGPDDNLDLWQFDGWSQDGMGGIYFYNDGRAKTPWGATRPDYGRKEVRQYILDNARMWLTDFHVDGLRVDSTIYIRNIEGHNDDPGNDIPDGWNLLQQMTDLTKKINPSAVTIAEDVGANEYLTKAVSEGGAGFSAQWEVGFPHILRAALDAVNDADRNISDINNALTRRYNGDAFRRVIYSDSHDSAANGGARLSEEIAPGNSTNVFARRRSLIASAVVLTAPGVPMIFQGQEFMQAGSFNDWQALNWNNVEKFSGIVLAHQHLIALRKNKYGTTKGLSGQSVAILHQDENNKVLVYHRWDQGGPGDDVIVVVNFSNSLLSDYRFRFPLSGLWKIRFNSDWKGYSPEFKNTENIDITAENDGALTLAPYSVLILSQDKN